MTPNTWKTRIITLTDNAQFPQLIQQMSNVSGLYTYVTQIRLVKRRGYTWETGMNVI